MKTTLGWAVCACVVVFLLLAALWAEHGAWPPPPESDTEAYNELHRLGYALEHDHRFWGSASHSNALTELDGEFAAGDSGALNSLVLKRSTEFVRRKRLWERDAAIRPVRRTGSSSYYYQTFERECGSIGNVSVGCVTQVGSQLLLTPLYPQFSPPSTNYFVVPYGGRLFLVSADEKSRFLSAINADPAPSPDARQLRMFLQSR